jgi:hypothetical protein
MENKAIVLNPGARIVTMPHAEIYGYLIDLITQLGEAKKVCDDFNAAGNDPGTTYFEQLEFSQALRRRAFYASAARIYPALFLEAYINFVATNTELQFRSDFERFPAHKKLSLYIYLLTNQAIEPKYVEFVKKVFALRDFEAHPKPETTIVGKSTNKKWVRYESSLYRMCTLTTITCSINKLVTETSLLLSKTKHKMPTPGIIPLEYPNCHSEENKRFKIS